ncbi:MAG: hypothetical protein ABID45_00560 [Patescibacteria group bacterium]
MKQQCKNCFKTFSIDSQDQEFFNKINIPFPKECPDCRQQRRLAFRNERSLYKRKCDLCKKEMISLYNSDSKFQVYCKDCWWSDKWSPLDYGIKYNPQQNFFEQYKKLLSKIPKLGFIVSHGENSDYCTYSVYYKNSYMCISGVVGENMLYSYFVNDSKDCVDCSTSFKLEKCYECMDSNNLFNSIYSKDCQNSSYLYFCRDLINCNNCIGCIGLRHKDYYIFNKPVKKEEFEKYIIRVFTNKSKINTFYKKYNNLIKKHPHIFNVIEDSENCTGNYLYNSKNCHSCFDAKNLENSKFCWNIPQGATEVYDINYSPKTELCYNSMSIVNGNHIFNSWNSWDCEFGEYLIECFYSKNLFGCIGLRHEENCILNTKYSAKQYNEIKNKIIKKLIKQGIYGEYFPKKLSPFSYNETIAGDFFPLKKEEAENQGFHWKEKLTDSIHEGVIREKNTKKCTQCNKIFKYIKQELDFYTDLNIPKPNKCFSCRHLARLKLRNPHNLWHRQCMCTQIDHNHTGRCQNEFSTTYSPNQPEIIYCQDCYNKEILL